MKKLAHGTAASTIFSYLHPASITNIVNIFSASVLAATLPKPTLVKLLNVKYKAVTYFACKEHQSRRHSLEHQ